MTTFGTKNKGNTNVKGGDLCHSVSQALGVLVRKQKKGEMTKKWWKGC